MSHANVSDALLQKIAKLLSLAGDKANEHEAAVAAAHAQRLLHEHNLSVAEVEASGKAKAAPVGERAMGRVVKSGSGTGWRSQLAQAIATTGYCRVLQSKTKSMLHLFWIGREVDVATCTYVYEYLERELERLAQEFSTWRWEEAKLQAKLRGMAFHDFEVLLRARRMHPLLARRSWLEGAVHGVSEKLHEDFNARRASEAGTALVVCRDGELSEYLSRVYPKLRVEKRQPKVHDAAAYFDGMATGRQLQVAPGIEQAPEQEKLTT